VRNVSIEAPQRKQDAAQDRLVQAVLRATQARLTRPTRVRPPLAMKHPAMDFVLVKC